MTWCVFLNWAVFSFVLFVVKRTRSNVVVDDYRTKVKPILSAFCWMLTALMYHRQHSYSSHTFRTTFAYTMAQRLLLILVYSTTVVCISDHLHTAWNVVSLWRRENMRFDNSRMGNSGTATRCITHLEMAEKNGDGESELHWRECQVNLGNGITIGMQQYTL